MTTTTLDFGSPTVTTPILYCASVPRDFSFIISVNAQNAVLVPKV